MHEHQAADLRSRGDFGDLAQATMTGKLRLIRLVIVEVTLMN
jgi:hypothetical protein